MNINKKELYQVVPDAIITTVTVLTIIILFFATDRSLISSTHTIKLLLFGVATIILTVATLLYVTVSPTSKTNKFHITVIDILLALYLISQLIPYYYKVLPNRDGPISTDLYLLLGSSLLYLCFRILCGRVKYLTYTLIGTLLLCGTGEAIYGNLQLFRMLPTFHSLFTITGTTFNPGPYAGIITPCMVLGIGVYLLSSSKIAQYAGAITSLSIMLVLPATQARAAWIGVAAGAAVILYKKYNLGAELKAQFKNHRQRSIIISVSAVVLGIALSSGLYFMKQGSANGRLLIWDITTQMIAEQPEGHGLGLYEKAFPEAQANFFSENPDSPYRLLADDSAFAFNEFLMIGAEGGVASLILALIITALILFYKRGRDNSEDLPEVSYLDTSIRASLLSIIVVSCFSYPAEIIPSRLTFVILLAILSLYFRPILSYRLMGRVVAAIALIPALLIGYRATESLEKRYEAELQWQEGYSFYNMQMYDSAIENYQEAYPELKECGKFLISYGKALTIDSQYNEAIEMLKRAEQYKQNSVLYNALGDCYKADNKIEEAEYYYKKSCNLTPSKFYPIYLLALLYHESGDESYRAKAVSTAQTLLTKKVKVQSTAISEMKEKMREIVGNTENN